MNATFLQLKIRILFTKLAKRDPKHSLLSNFEASYLIDLIALSRNSDYSVKFTQLDQQLSLDSECRAVMYGDKIGGMTTRKWECDKKMCNDNRKGDDDDEWDGEMKSEFSING